MKKLYAPWREEYSQSTEKEKTEEATEQDCTFCTRIKEDNDEENFILKRGKHTVTFLNRYPYNAGHLLVIPLKHSNTLEQLDSSEKQEVMQEIDTMVQLLKKELDAQGFNVGLNLGKVAGAGIPSHIHFHVLPRWSGDTNFLPTLGQTKQISFDMSKIYKKLKKALS